MPTTYEPLATTTLSSDQTAVTFSSISSAFNDLVLVCNGKVDIATTTKTNVGNGSIDTGANYSFTSLAGSGSSVVTNRETGQNQIYNEWYANWDTTHRSMTIIHFMDYANTNIKKTILTRGNNPATGVDSTVARWSSTAAINIIQIGTRNNGTKLATGSTFTLYGIKEA